MFCPMPENFGCLCGWAVISALFLFDCLWLHWRVPANVDHSFQRVRVHSANGVKSNIPVVTHSLFKAGTGNTLFFIASVIGIARTNHRQPALSKSLPLLEFMHVDLPVLDSSSLDTFKRIDDSSVGVYHKKYRNLTALVGQSDVYFGGYMQSFKYFHNYKEEILRQIAFVDSVITEADALITDAIKERKPTVLVGVHVRRGDFLKNSGTRGLHRTAPKEYFLSEMDSLRKRLHEPLTFLVISDSLEWCKTVFTTSDVKFVSGSTAFVDMRILTSMEHLILSVGTFGWWSGYLSSAKSVTYYKHWYHADTDTGRRFRPKDFFLPEWIAAE